MCDNSVTLEKQRIRKKNIELREQLSESERIEFSERICSIIMELPGYRSAERLLLYSAARGEVDLTTLFRDAIGRGKTVYFPKTYRSGLRFFRVENLHTDLSPGCFGILEPSEDAEEFLCQGSRQKTLCIVPGIAFSGEHQRVGYGKGYYDRFLALNPVKTIGVGYDFQFEDSFQSSEEDIPISILISNRGKEFIEMELELLCRQAHDTRILMGRLDTDTKNKVLRDAAECLLNDAETIIAANKTDLENGIANHMPEGLLDRLKLDEKRIDSMADGLLQIADLKDPIGDVLSMSERPNGLTIAKKRVPVGVIGIIFEARPNVVCDAFGLCFKSGNCAILKGGKEAIHSNIEIVNSLKKALRLNHVPESVLNLIESTDRNTTMELMKMNQYIDLLIPRGGKGLIQSVVENAKIPVIETGTGNCHVFVDEQADQEIALNIIENAKTQRIGVCNAIESLVIHSAVSETVLPLIRERLLPYRVEMRCDERSYSILKGQELVVQAVEEDFGTEYLDYIISVKTVDSVQEAIDHINRYTTGHSETIVTRNRSAAEQFLDQIDAACVYLNASTRFSDGNEFGLGAEIGISTQKLHARGPMGLEALTSYKYVIFGTGQVRP